MSWYDEYRNTPEPAEAAEAAYLKSSSEARERYRVELDALDAILDGPAPDECASQLPELRKRAAAAETILRDLVYKLDDLEADAGHTDPVARLKDEWRRRAARLERDLNTSGRVPDLKRNEVRCVAYVFRRAANEGSDRATELVEWLSTRETAERQTLNTYEKRAFRDLHSQARHDLWRPYRNSGENVI
jgi:hypothetical protein